MFYLEANIGLQTKKNLENNQKESHLAKVTKKAFNSITLLSMQGTTILHLLPFNYVYFIIFCSKFLPYRRNFLGGWGVRRSWATTTRIYEYILIRV